MRQSCSTRREANIWNKLQSTATKTNMWVAERQRWWQVYCEQGEVSENTGAHESKWRWNKFKGNRLDSVGIMPFSCVMSLHTPIREGRNIVLHWSSSLTGWFKNKEHGDGSLHFSYSCHLKEFHFTFTRPLLGVGDTGSSGPGYFVLVSRSLLQLCPSLLSQWLSYWNKRSAAAVILVHTAEAESMLRRCHLHSALHVEGPALPWETGSAGILVTQGIILEWFLPSQELVKMLDFFPPSFRKSVRFLQKGILMIWALPGSPASSPSSPRKTDLLQETALIAKIKLFCEKPSAAPWGLLCEVCQNEEQKDRSFGPKW